MSRRGRPPQARRLLEAAIRIDSGYALAHGNLAEVLSALGETARAIASYDKAARLSDGTLDAWFYRGRYHELSGDFARAVAAYRHLLALEPTDIRAVQAIADHLVRRGRLREAERHLRLATRIEPPSPSALGNLAGVLVLQGRRQEAIATYRNADRLGAGTIDGRFYSTRASELSGDLEGAKAAYRSLLQLAPNHFLALHGLANILVKRGQQAEAIAYYKRTAAIRAEPDLLDNMGVASARRGELDKAMRCFRRVLAVVPDHRNAHRNLGVALLRAGKVEQAKAHLSRAGLRP